MKNLYDLTSDYIQLYEMLEAGAETPEENAQPEEPAKPKASAKDALMGK